MHKSEVLHRLREMREDAQEQGVMQPHQIAVLIRHICHLEDVPFAEYMLKKAWIESRFNQLAVNRSSGAAGLYQIMWFNVLKRWRDDEDFNPYIARDNIIWTIEFTEYNIEFLHERDINVGMGELYLAHQQGAAGAATILRSAAKGLSIAALPAETERNVKANIPHGAHIHSCQQFVHLWREKMQDSSIPDELLADNSHALRGEDEHENDSVV
jgi:hypothetical protein